MTWKWNPTTNTFQRYYNGTTPDMLADGAQNQTPNVVVQYVQISHGPWLENDQGGLEVQADLYPNASGTAVVYRNGMAYPGHVAPRRPRLAHAVRQRVRRAHPAGAGHDLGGARAQHGDGHHHAVGRHALEASGRLAGHHRQQEAVGGVGEHARVRAGLRLVEHAGGGGTCASGSAPCTR